MRLILLFMSGVNGTPADRQIAVATAAQERAEQAVKSAHLLSDPQRSEIGPDGQPVSQISKLLQTYLTER